ncbi:DeoR/GlpR family DNA-binding transcription regulator [Paramicrobacterium sp. CJ85]|uniref:DeoR/GlpR family DNA-binding transcription regulator n=1 Tax=Paramicrobacterium sp. CJ85 TaxID=3445355 RepID=UPI003F60FAC7
MSALGIGVDKRHAAILSLLQRDKRVDVNDLAEAFGVADETIRRDLRTLEQQGRLARAHGGAILPTSLMERFPQLTGARVPEWPSARAALEFVPKTGSIFVDAGEACQSLAALLPDSASLHVVTNAVPVALTASRKESLGVYTLGGAVESDGELSGQWTREALATVRVDVAFLSCDGVDENGRLMASTPRTAAIKRAAFEAAAMRIVLIDGGQSPLGLVSFARLADVTAVVADPPLASAHEAILREAGVQYLTQQTT